MPFYSDLTIGNLEALGTLTAGAQLTVLGQNYQLECAPSSTHSLQRLDTYERFQVASGDVAAIDDATKERSELYVRDGAARAIAFDIAFWVSMALRIPSASAFPSASATTWCIIGQIHSTASPNIGDVLLSPAWAQDISGGVFTVQTRSFAGTPVTSNPPAITRYTDAALPRDTWINLVYQLTFDPSAGAMQIWRNGSSVFNSTIPMGYNQPDAGYPKFGIYRSASTTTTTIEFANVEWGTTSLASRITTPLPNPY